jgi:serine protease Do
MSRKGVILVVLAALLACLVMVNLASAGESEKKTKRGWLGVHIQDINTELKEAMDLKSRRGVLVRDVVEDSPADEAGIKREDVILLFDGKELDDSDELVKVVRKTVPGDKAELSILRDGKEKSISVILGQAPKDELHVLEYSPEHKKFKTYSYGFSSGGRIGVKVQDLNQQLGDYFGVKDAEGALVTEADEDGPAHKAGLRGGDVIVEVDGDEIDDVEELREEISDKEEGDKVKIKVIRDRQPKVFTVEVEETEEWSFGHLKGLDKLKVLPGEPALPGLLWEEKKFRQHEEELGEELEELKEELEELREEMKELKERLR